MAAEGGQGPNAFATASARLSLQLLGSMQILADGHRVALRGRKARAALAVLALADPPRETRERLVGLLWSESDEARARASLRQVLIELRDALAAAGCHGLDADRETLALHDERLEVDVRDIVRAAEAGVADPRIAETPHLAETLLADLDDVDPAFRVWLLAKRQTLQDRLLRALETALRRAADDARARLSLAEALRSLDPSSEEACRAIMEVRAATGDVGGALRAYKLLWDTLDADYGMEPSEPTQMLVARIKQGTEPGPVVPAGPPPVAVAGAHPPARLVLRVGAFPSVGVPADRLHVLQGFRHQLIAGLVRFREWFVTDAMVPSSPSLRPPPIAGTYEVEATGYPSGDAVCLVLTLRDADAGVYVWSDRFDLALENWFTAQQQVVRRIAMSLNVQLSGERLARLAAEPDVSLEAYDRWLRGQDAILSFRPERWAQAEQLFNETIRAAPNFSPGHSSLAQMNNLRHIIHPGWRRERARAEQTLELARRAVQLDPVDSRAQLHLGWSYTMLGLHAQGAVHMDLACELNPNDSWTMMSVALFQCFSGNHARALELAEASLGLTVAPSRTHWGYQVTIQYLAGDDEGAIRAHDRSGDVIRTLSGWRAAALARLGRREEVPAAMEAFYRTVSDTWFGPKPATPAAMGNWLLHLYPIALREDWERLRDGVAQAGIPFGAIDHGAWW